MGQPQSKRKNARISIKRREKLINDVVFKGQAVFRVAQRLRIKPSTARLIVMKYNQTGTFYHRKMHEDLRRERQKSGKKELSQEGDDGDLVVKEQSKEEKYIKKEEEYYPFLRYFSPVDFDATLPFDLGSTV